MFMIGDKVWVDSESGLDYCGVIARSDVGCKSGLEFRVLDEERGLLEWCKASELSLLERPSDARPDVAPPAVAKPPQDPKAAFGATKANLALNPGTAAVEQALAQEDGAIKYGPYNWRYNPVEAMTYLAAAKRHLEAFIDGQDIVEDSGRVVHNLGAVMACCAIVIDAKASGTLVDNRPANGKAAEAQDASKAAKADKWAGRAIDWSKGR